jgi:uncharacterized protein (TIGR03382 family)
LRTPATSASPLGAAATAALLRPRRIRRGHLMLECRLRRDNVPTRRASHDAYAGAQYSNGANKDESFLISL